MPKRAKDPAAFSLPDEPDHAIVINPEDVYADDHPFVKAHPELFVEAHDPGDVIAAPPRAKSAKVEQATAAPGEKRDH